ncbi:MAG TPA: MetQ/NlpA family ABC transporter substrate-binding protein [Coriobacteriia bacterium]|nr:MetQ/NlpA family ABC transporter substrate-binding protein [Coriobacteriia bacterium]
MRTTRLAPAALAAAAALSLAACSSSTTDDGTAAATDGSADVVTLTVGASPVPHAQILEYIDKNLAADAGIDIEIVEYTDYVQPNVALSEGDLDANYFQHVPYFDTEVAEKGYKFEHSVGIHIEPYGVYSNTYTSVADLPDGATVAVTNDPSNQARALVLLENEGLFTLADVENPSVFDVADNPRNIKLVEVAADQLPRQLEDVDAAVINGNFALEAGLVPSQDAIALESGEDNPYANIVAYRTEDKDSEAIATLISLLTSDEVRTHIEETWPNGELIPAF